MYLLIDSLLNSTKMYTLCVQNILKLITVHIAQIPCLYHIQEMINLTMLAFLAYSISDT